MESFSVCTFESIVLSLGENRPFETTIQDSSKQVDVNDDDFNDCEEDDNGDKQSNAWCSSIHSSSKLSGLVNVICWWVN